MDNNSIYTVNKRSLENKIENQSTLLRKVWKKITFKPMTMKLAVNCRRKY